MPLERAALAGDDTLIFELFLRPISALVGTNLSSSTGARLSADTE
jgi:hypothetical protein